MSFMRKRRRAKYRRKSRGGLSKYLALKGRFEQKNAFFIKQQEKATLPYSYTTNVPGVTTGNKTNVVRTFRMTSLFDPEYENGGSTAFGHDQWATKYGKYMVLGADVTVTIPPQGYAVGTQPGYIGVLIGPLTTDQKSSINTFPNTSYFKDIVEYRIKGYQYRHVPVTTSGNGKSVSMTVKYDMRSIKDIVKGEYREELTVPFSTTPTFTSNKNIVATVFYHAADNASPVRPIVKGLRVKIRYHVICLDPKNITDS